MRQNDEAGGREEALRYIKYHDPRLYAATKAHHASLPTELPVKRTANARFAALISIVVSQQLGTAAADSIFARVKRVCGGKITPDSVAKTTETHLRAAGLSGVKGKTNKTLAQAVKSQEISLISLKRDTVDNFSGPLLSLWGIGPWSVEMFSLFALGYPDVFSPGDLGLVRAVEDIYGRKGITRTSLLALSKKWSPYRSWVCLLLWRSKDAASLSVRTPAKGRHRS